MASSGDRGRLGSANRYRADLPRPSYVLLRSRLLAGCVAAGAVVLTVLAAFAHPWLLVVDEPLSRLLRQPELVDSLRWLTEGGAPTSAAIISVVAAVALWPSCRAFAMALPVTVAAGVASDVALKMLVARPRPPAADIGTALASYPSGHVIQATIVFGLLVPALYLVTGRRTVFWLTTGLLGVMVPVVAFSRVGLGAHWPTDVVAGFLIGASLLLAAEWFVGSRWATRHCGACRLHTPRGEVPITPVDRRGPPG